MLFTNLLPEITPTLKLRGYLAQKCFSKCGRNLQITKDVRLYNCKNISFGDDVFLSAGVWIMASDSVIIESEVMFGPYSIAITGDHTKYLGSFRFGAPLRAPIHIKKGSWICAHGIVTKGVTIGNGSVLGANSVATKDIEDHVFSAGVPAKVIKGI
jgi:maltose O-acetyltransferase